MSKTRFNWYHVKAYDETIDFLGEEKYVEFDISVREDKDGHINDYDLKTCREIAANLWNNRFLFSP